MTTYVGASFAYGLTGNTSTAGMGPTFALRIDRLHAAFVGCGLVQTADTGQLDTATIASAPSGTLGYRVYRFNDTRQATEPLFLRVSYVQNGQNLRLTFTVGTGTNGAGTLTGTVSNPLNAGGNTGTSPGTVQIYTCHTEGFFGLMLGPNNTGFSTASHSFTIARTKNGSSFDSKGWLMWADGGTPNTSGFVTFTARSGGLIGASTEHYCIAPGVPASSALLNGDKQLYPHFYADPDIKMMWHQFSALGAEFPIAPGAFSATPYGASARTFLFGGSTGSPAAESSSNNAFRLAMLWE